MKEWEMEVFTTPYSVTLFNISSADIESNRFNDIIGAMYFDEHGQVRYEMVWGTTDPGLDPRLNPGNKKGIAMIQRGKQFKGAYQYQNPSVNPKQHGHKGREAFVQVGDISGTRDNSKSGGLNLGASDIIVFPASTKINGHDMGTLGADVNKWSEGCWGAPKDRMRKIYDIALIQIDHGLGDIFSLAMLHENMF